MSFIRNVLFAGSALSAGSLGCFGYWAHQNSRLVPKDQKGNLCLRMKEVATAFHQRHQVKDSYTAKKHIESVVSLPAKARIADTKLQQELHNLSTTYYAGYLQEVLQANPFMTNPVFEFRQNLPVALVPLPGHTHQGFVFAGPLYALHSSSSRQDIINRNYVRCESHLIMRKGPEASQEQYQRVDTLITGTIDKSKCYQLKKDILRDAAMLAADISETSKIDPKDPISDTPVIDCNEKGVFEVGDLTSIPKSVKEKILRGNFVASNFYAYRQTRLSPEQIKLLGAIVTGTTDESACPSFHSGDTAR